MGFAEPQGSSEFHETGGPTSDVKILSKRTSKLAVGKEIVQTIG